MVAPAAGRGTSRPLRPLSQHAVTLGRSAHQRSLLRGPWVAGKHLLERAPKACLPRAGVELSHDALSLADAEASAAAVRPLVPGREDAVTVAAGIGLRALRGRRRAELPVLAPAHRRPAAEVGLLGDVPVPPAEALSAGRGALAPVGPLPPQAIDALLITRLRVAGHDLRLVVDAAQQPTISWCYRDVPVPPFGPASAAASACTPAVPVRPLAVGRTLAAGAFLLARGDLFEREVAAPPGSTGAPDDLPVALVDA
mmetsp:Transcript_98273/g.286617  ORF Transcript_98273/g.286617 Transcript_98273/m.286617 type:complete len:255 (-) Transcript_98273:32-796(-)